MGVAMQASIVGLECQLKHEPSGALLLTTPPRDNGGDGSSFSPTDLVGAALASCALTTLSLVAPKEGLTWDHSGARARVEKDMVGPPRKIGSLRVLIHLPQSTPVEHRARIEQIARTCPVALSLHPDMQIPMTFLYE